MRLKGIVSPNFTHILQLNMLSKFLRYLDVISPVLALIVAWVSTAYVKRRWGRSDFSILFYLVLQITLNLTGNTLQSYRINNLYLYHLNCLFSFVIIATFFFQLFPAAKAYRKWILWTSGLFFVYFFVNLIFIQSYKTFPSGSYSLCAFLLTSYILIFFRTCLVRFSEHNIFQISEVWYSSALLVYFASSFFIFISYSYLSQFNVKSIPYLWKTHNVFMAFMCILVCKGFLCRHSIREYLS